jgi:predicted Kef-type K+ transport protein
MTAYTPGVTNLAAFGDALDRVPAWVVSLFLVCAILMPWIARRASRLGGFREALLCCVVAVGLSSATSSPALLTVCVLGLAGVMLGAWHRIANLPRSERRAHKRSGRG